MLMARVRRADDWAGSGLVFAVLRSWFVSWIIWVGNSSAGGGGGAEQALQVQVKK